MGMVLLPISRHSALASFFKLSASTTLAFHMIQAYTLSILVLIHGFFYVSWIPVFSSLTQVLKRVYPVLNPTYLYHEAWPGNTGSLGIWRASLPFTGLFTTTILLLIFITTFPEVRRKHFNIFYFTHLTVIIGVIVICLHASTMFYCTAPGLILWIVDWGMRVYELWSPVEGRVTTIGNGYYVLDMPIPRNRLDGCACTSPLAHFYIYHSDSSSRELHPFTTITHLASENSRTPKEVPDLRIQFLFRKRSHSLDPAAVPIDDHLGILAAARALFAPKNKDKLQWTEKLASHADGRCSETPNTTAPARSVFAKGASITSPMPKYPSRETDRDVETAEFMNRQHSSITGFGPDHRYPIIEVSLRLEGPYFTHADPSRYQTVICLVAGTGISGAIAIANAFVEMERQRKMIHEGSCAPGDVCDPCGAGARDAKCIANITRAIWQRCVVVWSVREEDFIEMSFLRTNRSSSLEVQYQLTGKGRKRIPLKDTIAAIDPQSPTWCYLSGPNAFITSGEKACGEIGVDFYGAR